MQKYKITASKSQKKYTFVVSEENEKLAKKKVHDDWYSILSVEIFDESNTQRLAFVFEAEKDSQIKKWKVVWDDIFKIYLKLRDWMWYNIKKLYSTKDENKTQKEKDIQLKEIEEQYNYFSALNKKWNKKEEKKQDIVKENINIDNFYLKKELEETYKLIDHVLKKLNNLLVNQEYFIEDTKKEKLKTLYNSLVKIKSSTNISKLREVWEAALLKVWEIELKSLEKSKDEKWEQLLEETNKLLKQIWSEEKFIPENRDIKKQINKVFSIIQNFIGDFKKNSKKEKPKEKKDETSHDYLKTVIFLNKYKQKLKQNNINILKNFFVFIFPFWKNISKKQDLLVRRKVIKQNIFLFKAKSEWKTFSYTKVIKWFDYILETIFNFFFSTKNYLLFIIILYSFIFFIFLNLSYYNISPIFYENLSYEWLFYFMIFTLLYIAITFSKWVYSLVFNFLLLFSIIFLWFINF